MKTITDRPDTRGAPQLPSPRRRPRGNASARVRRTHERNHFDSIHRPRPRQAAADAPWPTRATPRPPRSRRRRSRWCMAGRDLLGIAQTGTGKTAAFALPILQRLAADRRPAPRRGCRVLVLSPTRELATQIAESFRAYGRHMGFTVAVVFGGVKYGPQVQALAAGVDVLVATPGRLIDHLQEKVANLSRRRGVRPRRGRPDARPRLPAADPAHRRRTCRRCARTCSSRPPCRARSASWPASC